MYITRVNIYILHIKDIEILLEIAKIWFKNFLKNVYEDWGFNFDFYRFGLAIPVRLCLKVQYLSYRGPLIKSIILNEHRHVIYQIGGNLIQT